ncbi:MAG: M28 family metallopeptidase [Candidatus Helarchaeota archaeon]
MEEKETIKQQMQFIIQDICDKIGPRPPCSDQEAQAAMYIENELKKCVDETKIENFHCHPGYYQRMFQLPMINLVIATVVYWIFFFIPFFPFLFVALGLVAASVIIIQTNLLRNIELIDRFFKKKKSTNVFGRIKPKEQVKQVIVIGGHHDSHWEFTLLRKNAQIYGLLMAFPVIFNHLMVGIFILKVILFFLFTPFLFFPLVDLIFLIVLTVLSPILIYTCLNVLSDLPVMGADDNLTSIAVLLSIGRHLKSSGRLNTTEVWLVSHGCEEIGDRGSKRFSKKHHDELKDAYVINIDMVGGKNSNLKVDVVEEVYMIKLCKELGLKIAEIAKDLSIPIQVGGIEAFTDSMAYSRNKIKACSIVGIPTHGFPAHYHTREDTIDKIEFEHLWDCYRILFEFIKRVDEERISIPG